MNSDKVITLTTDGKDLLRTGCVSRRDVAKAAIIRRLNRLAQGNYGDFKPGVMACMSFAPDNGRPSIVYYAQAGKTLSNCCAGV